MSISVYSRLAHDAIGSYLPARFYSLSKLGVPHEPGLYSVKGVGRATEFSPAVGEVPGGVATTIRLVVLLHETSHYLHDLSLGACMASDCALDQSFGALLEGFQRQSKEGRQQIKAPTLLDWNARPNLRT